MGKSVSIAQALVKLKGLKRGLAVAIVYAKGKLQEYPHQPSSSRYKRTNRLRTGWASKASHGGLTQTLGNNTEYLDDVQGSQRGNPYFKRVWGKHSIRSVSNRERRRIGEIVANEIKRSIS